MLIKNIVKMFAQLCKIDTLDKKQLIFKIIYSLYNNRWFSKRINLIKFLID